MGGARSVERRGHERGGGGPGAALFVSAGLSRGRWHRGRGRLQLEATLQWRGPGAALRVLTLGDADEFLRSGSEAFNAFALGWCVRCGDRSSSRAITITSTTSSAWRESRACCRGATRANLVYLYGIECLAASARQPPAGSTRAAIRSPARRTPSVDATRQPLAPPSRAHLLSANGHHDRLNPMRSSSLASARACAHVGRLAPGNATRA